MRYDRSDSSIHISTKDLLEYMGWSQSKAARELNLSYSTVQRWVKGSVIPDSKSQYKILRVLEELKVDFEELRKLGIVVK